MLTLRTDKATYRFCTRCKARMTVIKDEPGLLIAHCPNRTADEPGHDVVIGNEFGPAVSKELVRYVRQVFGLDGANRDGPGR